MTVITVVDVVGVSPSGQTSGGLPVNNDILLYYNSLFSLPVITIIGILGTNLLANSINCNISFFCQN